jgi:hypothetical protein
VFETGPLSVWIYHALAAEGVLAICIDARLAKGALDMAPNKATRRMLTAWRILPRSASIGRSGSRA